MISCCWSRLELMALDRLLDLFPHWFYVLVLFHSVFCFSYSYVRQTKLGQLSGQLLGARKNTAWLIDWLIGDCCIVNNSSSGSKSSAQHSASQTGGWGFLCWHSAICVLSESEPNGKPAAQGSCCWSWLWWTCDDGWDQRWGSMYWRVGEWSGSRKLMLSYL